MAELYLFDQNDKFINILTEDEGLVDTWFKDYQNHVEDESFVFNVQSNSPLLKNIVEENQVAFYDRDDRLRLARMKDLSEVTTSDNGAISHEIRVICEPSFLELHDHFIEDRRITDGTAQTALNRVLDGSRYVGEVTIDLGLATDDFYWIDGIEAVFKILETWGGALKDTITLDDNNEIIERKLWIVQRLGTDNGLIVEPDYNAETISRNTLSYPETALWGQGSSLEIEDDEGELTGGHTRYITFEEVEWKVSKGDPVDKPKGQKWVGDPDALARDGYLDNGTRKHRFGHFSNQDYEDPEELLWATWQGLQDRKLKEIVHEASIYEDEKGVSLGDTVTILSREYSKPIELQSQITGLEYDLLYPKELNIIIGKYIDMSEDPLQKEVDDLKVQAKKPPKPITDISFPDIKPGTPVNFTATGAFQTIQLFWDYDSKVYISHYEVYGSQISDFIPDEQSMLYRGRVSAFSHEVSTDEKWYYYVRSVNTRGTPGEFSNRVNASSVRIINDDILFGSITSDLLSDNLDLANKLTPETFDDIVQNLDIKGDVNILNGTTIIQDGVVGTAAIANLAVDSFHLKQGIIDNVHIADATIEHGKIKSLNADKITVGDLKGIDIYGAKFRSSAGTDYMEIVGGKIDLMLNNGRKMNLSPTGLYGYNASGSVRFQADQSLVTSAAMGTSNSNVYLASDNGFEARSVRLSSIPGDGNINSYQYNPMRALVYRFPDIPNGYFTLYNGGEFRFTGESITSPVYQDIRAAGYYGNFLDARGSADNIYVRPRTANGELRVTTSGSTGAYRDVRARGFAGTRIGLSTAFTGVKNFYVTPAGDGEVRITARADTSAYRPLRTSKVYETSSEKYKSDIQVYDKSALSIINESVIYDYIKEGSNQREIGLIIEREMPSCIIDEDAVDGYSMRSLSWKAIQELDVNLTTEITRIDDKLNKLELENQYMKQKIKQLEGAA